MSRFLSTLLCAGLLAAGCGASPTTPDVAYPVTMSLHAGDTRTVNGLYVKFIGVTDDWRCPITALCVSAGDAYLQFEFSTDRRFVSQRLQAVDQTQRKLLFEGYSIEVTQLLPARDIRVLMSQVDYQATIEVRR
jgi:hypothetical protein